MASRISNEISQHKASLEKLVSENSVDTIQERVTDLLNVLVAFPMTIEVLKETGIGQTLQDIKNKFPDSSMGTLAKRVIGKWRKDCKTQEDSKKPSSVQESGNENSRGNDQSSHKSAAKNPDFEGREREISISRTKSYEEEDWNEDHYDKLNEVRRKIMQLFTDAIKVACNESVARFIAYNIEDNINRIHPHDKDSKAYSNKAKSLIFNLKNNEQLRIDVADGIIPAERLVGLTSAEMAPEQLRKNRQDLSETMTKARRSDIYQITAAEIQAAHGIDPNKGEFQCKKCKGKKTTHYSMQTRSSDEPMTVFVCCLTCGNRWRC